MALLRVGAVAVVLLGCVGTSVKADDEFPGGWDAEVGYKSFATQAPPRTIGGVGSADQGLGGYGANLYGGMSRAGGVAASGMASGRESGSQRGAQANRGQLAPTSFPGGVGGAASEGGTVNAMGTLVHSIRYATATKRHGRGR